MTDETVNEEIVDEEGVDEEVVDDYPDAPDINPPDPVEVEDGEVEYPADPDFQPVDNPDQDLTPAEADEDYVPEDAADAEDVVEEDEV